MTGLANGCGMKVNAEQFTLASGGRLFGGGVCAVDWQAMGFRYVRNNSWLPLAQLQSGYPTACSTAIFVPHRGIALLLAILPEMGAWGELRRRYSVCHGLWRPAGMICGPVRSGVRNAEWRRGGVMRVRRKPPME